MGSLGPSIPASKSAASCPSNHLQNFLNANPFVTFIRFQWIDLSGVLKARITPVEQASTAAALNKPLKCGQVALDALADHSIIPNRDSAAAHLLFPDWNSLKLITSDRTLRYASVMCSIFESAIGKPAPAFECCPRETLSKVIQRASSAQGLSFLMGFEIEFMIVKASENGQLYPHSNHPGRSTVAGLRDPCFQYLEECVNALISAGVGVECFHVEGLKGQFEIALSARPPIQAVDELVFSYDIIKAVVGRHGYIATMSPKPLTAREGNGAHAHISVTPPADEEAFLAGVLKRLPQICAFSLPYEVSYSRVRKREAGESVSWGTENKDVPVRKIRPGHWEVRCVDATCNMYLTMAAIISAGVLGVQRREPLVWEDSTFSTDKREPTLLPKSLGNSLAILEEKAHSFEDLVPEKLVRRYALLKKYEMEKLNDLGDDRVRELLATLF